jgi:hypothetical protein
VAYDVVLELAVERTDVRAELGQVLGVMNSPPRRPSSRRSSVPVLGGPDGRRASARAASRRRRRDPVVSTPTFLLEAGRRGLRGTRSAARRQVEHRRRETRRDAAVHDHRPDAAVISGGAGSSTDASSV